MKITNEEFKKISGEVRVAFLNLDKQKREAIIKPILIDIFKKYKRNYDDIVQRIFVNAELDKPELLKISEAVKNEYTSY